MWTHTVALVGWAVQTAESGSVRLEAKVLAAVVREACARALLRLMTPLGWSQPAPRPAHPRGVSERRAAPVLLVPGRTWSRASLLFLRQFLVQRGWRWVWPVNRGRGANGGLAQEAELLARRIRELRSVSGAQQIDIVGFSVGGLVAAWVLRHHPEARASVRRLVTVGTPWRGTKLAVFSPGAAAREIRFNSHLLDDLWPLPVPVFSIWSATDLVVVPGRSAAPPSDQGTDVCIEAAGHVELLVSARAFRAVQAALEHPLTEASMRRREIPRDTSPTLIPPRGVPAVSSVARDPEPEDPIP
ncbi:MAG: hypothetical protein KTR31_39450 [Myxococcales bacterium]|nr:hypothetical protein [Myxococcales bacterium]